MFDITYERKSFYQWDLNQRILCDVKPGCEIHFDNGTTQEALIRLAYSENSKVYVDVPNIMLEQTNNLTVMAYPEDDKGMHTVITKVYAVKPRKKPADYVEPDDEPSFRQEMQGIMQKTFERAEQLETNVYESEKRAEGFAESSKHYSEMAKQVASKNGYFNLYIDEIGNLYMVRENIDSLGFNLNESGELEVLMNG